MSLKNRSRLHKIRNGGKVKKYSVGIDIGGTNIAVALVTADGKIKSKIKFPTKINRGEEIIIDEIVWKVSRVVKSVPVKSVAGIGIGAAGFIYYEEGTIKFSPNMFHREVPFVSMMNEKIRSRGDKRLLGLPLYFDNDANVAAWGAYQMDVPKTVENLICVTLGTGVGGGIIIDGKIYHGADGYAGEIGHIILNPDGPKCNCGNYGCMEKYVGAGSIVERTLREIKRGRRSMIEKLVNGRLEDMTTKTLYDAAKRGDELANEMWKNTGRCLGISLAGIVNLLNPEFIVLAGGVAKAGDLILSPMRRTIKEHANTYAAKAVRCIISKLGDNLGVVGAALLVRQKDAKSF